MEFIETVWDALAHRISHSWIKSCWLNSGKDNYLNEILFLYKAKIFFLQSSSLASFKYKIWLIGNICSSSQLKLVGFPNYVTAFKGVIYAAHRWQPKNELIINQWWHSRVFPTYNPFCFITSPPTCPLSLFLHNFAFPLSLCSFASSPFHSLTHMLQWVRIAT